MGNCQMDNRRMDGCRMDNNRMPCKDNPGRRNGCSVNTKNSYARTNLSDMNPQRRCQDSTERRISSEDQMPSAGQIHWGDLPLGMGYVPSQMNWKTYSLQKGLAMGTIFPELCKPFCGKGGGFHC